MPGWKAQWYGSVPAVLIVMAWLVAPRKTVEVSKRPLSWVAVWMSVSALRQATVCPTLSEAVAGENDIRPRSPAIVITRSAVTLVGGGVVVAVGDDGVEGAGDDPLPPQLGIRATARSKARRGAKRR